MARFPIVSAALLSAALASFANAQLDRETSTPTEHRTFFNLTTAGIQTLVNQGYRLSDIEVVSATANSTLFSGTAVKNTGAYDTGWWWYYGQTPAQLLTLANQHGARLIDIERYTVGNSILYAGIMVDNTGPSAVQWYLWPEVAYGDVMNLVTATQTRLVDIEYHETNGENRVTLLAIRNTGIYQRAWWFCIDYDLPFVSSMMTQHSARLTELERIGPNRYAAIMVQDGTPSWWYAGVSAAHVLEREDYHLARATDIEMYLDNGTPRYLALMVDNYANFQPYGTACATSFGVLVHDVPSGSGFVGTEIVYRGQHFVPATLGVLNFGVAPTNVSLAALGLPTCALYTTPDVSVPLTIGGNGVAQIQLHVPNQPSLVGIEFCTQCIGLDRAAGLAGVATSNGIETRIRG